MKKVFGIFTALLLMSSTSFATSSMVRDICVERAFDAMEDAANLGFSDEMIGEVGDLVYCICAPQCTLE